ncbi:MAG: M48 family metallopeptidase [Leptothrix sp. (in: b-proteobacteria)]
MPTRQQAERTQAERKPADRGAAADDAAPPPAEALLRPAQANRELTLGSDAAATRIGFVLKRSARRSIGFVIGAQGLVVSAPRWVNLGQVDEAVRSKADWILRKLADQGQRLQQRDAARISWADGVTLPYLGAPLRVRLGTANRRIVLQPADAALGLPATLCIGLPTDSAPELIRLNVQRWLQARARELFAQRIAHHAPGMGVHERVQRLALSSARTRWGSASSRGSIRLNWRLIHFDLPTLDYVVVHELAHLHEMNHSPAFWAIVAAVMPDYTERRRSLRDGAVPLFD